MAVIARQILARQGRAAASNGTVGLVTPEGASYGGVSVTTPNPLALHELMARLKAQGITHLMMEASSHDLTGAVWLQRELKSVPSRTYPTIT
ncbi:Mur ligase family protein [Bradyrhizobium sp. BWA-3-5]|nr:Mur ligase family protein [Bradyrhizobium sp. BWA-3-5]WOH63738.1 Mur ligase family protein [Bradyrhizobium sp. BWA-3-5]